MSAWVTVWEFRSVDGRQRVIAFRPWYSDDFRFQHEYQRIIFQGLREDYAAP